MKSIRQSTGDFSNYSFENFRCNDLSAKKIWRRKISLRKNFLSPLDDVIFLIISADTTSASRSSEIFQELKSPITAPSHDVIPLMISPDMTSPGV